MHKINAARKLVTRPPHNSRSRIVRPMSLTRSIPSSSLIPECPPTPKLEIMMHSSGYPRRLAVHSYSSDVHQPQKESQAAFGQPPLKDDGSTEWFRHGFRHPAAEC